MGQWGREHANGPKTAPSGPFVPKAVFRDAVAKARSYHFAKTTFTKTWCRPACSELRFSELGNMLCFLLSLIPRPFSPGPLSLVLGVWVLWK